jgi:hypothetical protein
MHRQQDRPLRRCRRGRTQVIASPPEQQVGVDAVLQRNRRHPRARLQALLDQAGFERPIVMAPRRLRNRRLTLHGVHDLVLVYTISRRHSIRSHAARRQPATQEPPSSDYYG